MSGIIAFFTALPELIQLLNRLADLADRFLKWSERNKLNDWISTLENTMDKLEVADTPEKKLSSARDIVNIIRNL